MSNGLRWPSENAVLGTTAKISRPAAPQTAESMGERSRGGATNWTGCAVPKAAGKYHNVKTNGYASKREAERAFQLKLMQEAGQIRNLREQVDFVLIPKQDGERPCTYRADFVYEEWGSGPSLSDDPWGEIVEDCKGMRTDVYRIKRKLMQLVYGVRIRET